MKPPSIVCGEVPPHDVIWQVSLNDPERHPQLTRALEWSKTAFGAFQKASSKLGNPSFSDVTCTIVRDEDSALEGKSKKPRTRRTKKKS